MTVNSYLSSFASELVIDEDEREGIDKSISTIKERLQLFFGSEVTNKIVFGSYTRRTILPRIADDHSDIDLMVVFGYNSEKYQPQTYLGRLKKFAEKYYSTSIIHQSRPSIVIELNHIRFELTPATIPYGYSSGTYLIPKNTSEWLYTSPNDFNDKLTKCNENNVYKIKPIVRLIQRWNVTKNYRSTPSFYIEKEIAENMLYSYLSCTSYVEYAIMALKTIRNYENSELVDIALDRIDRALTYESNGEADKAISEIKKVFPELY